MLRAAPIAAGPVGAALIRLAPRARTARRSLVVGAALLVQLFPAFTAAQSPGSPAPVCHFTAWNGDGVSLRDRYRGKIVYVDFWASWCAPCAQSFPFMNALHDEFGPRGLIVLGINVDEKREDAQRFLARHPARFPLARGADGECASRFGVAAMPTSVLVDREGNVRHVHQGFRSSDGPVLRETIARLLDDAGHADPTSTR